MNSTISIQQIESIRREFRAYLREKHPDWSDNTISTHSSDSFYAFNNNVGVDFWTCFISDEAMQNARDNIQKFLANEKQSEQSSERANGYSTSMKYFKAFLDDKYSSLAKDWSEKTVRDAYLKTAFQSWMRIQKKSNGEPYASGTINAYTTALKNSTCKLNLGESIKSDLFCYTNADEFEYAHDIILSAPNFNEVDIAAGNKAYSNGMVLYARFLKELGEPSCWIFQGNPKYYDVIGAINDLESITWSVNQYQKQIKEGDKAYIWLSGSEGGIVAVGTVVCNPELKQLDLDDQYSRGEALKKEPFLAVVIKLERKLVDKVVLRTLLLTDERTKKLEILTYPGATNFRVTKEQDAVIESIITGSYINIPVIPTAVLPETEKNRYWMYAPGEDSCKWDEFYKKGIMGIGWDGLGDLSQYPTKEAMKEEMKSVYGKEYSYKNSGHATWQFANEVSIGDIIFVKRGLKKIIGRGIITSEYIFDATRSEYKHIHSINWTNNGEWEHDGQIVMKTLTDITPYTDYVQKLESLFLDDNTVNIIKEEKEIVYDNYTETDFLGEVFMDADHYDVLVNLLSTKKNLILQGAPGVGKTFAAKRLAYSIMKKRDTSRVMMVQFHQSYSYEDFIMGYRPTKDGFELTAGPFYQFCKAAQDDDERDYFFIIDEINRGNLSKIFGELLMLIEKDKRGEKLRLLYSNELFSVPENLHIIGMMNTADRSLAMIDYALRRRFAFYELEPAFDSEGFKAVLDDEAHFKFSALVEQIKALNEYIIKDEALGGGFRIGHSYLCTNDEVTDEWLTAVVKYELLPLLNEYWFDEQAKIDQWTKKLCGALND